MAAAPASTSRPKVGIIELENTTRSVYVFRILGSPNQEGIKPILGRLVLGDAADKVLTAAHGPVRDELLCPNPVRQLTPEEYAALGEKNLAIIDEYVARGILLRREIPA